MKILAEKNIVWKAQLEIFIKAQLEILIKEIVLKT